MKTADRNLKIFTENIEEDLKILEHIKMGIKADTQAPNIETRDISRRKFEAIEHILSDYKRVLKENEELKNNTRKNENELEFDIDCDWIALQKMLDESEKSNEYISYKNEKWIKEKYCIPIQKVKDKIEELKKKVEELTDDKGYWGGSDLLEQIKVLQELLESEERK